MLDRWEEWVKSQQGRFKLLFIIIEMGFKLCIRAKTLVGWVIHIVNWRKSKTWLNYKVKFNRNLVYSKVILKVSVHQTILEKHTMLSLNYISKIQQQQQLLKEEVVMTEFQLRTIKPPKMAQIYVNLMTWSKLLLITTLTILENLMPLEVWKLLIKILCKLLI